MYRSFIPDLEDEMVTELEPLVGDFFNLLYKLGTEFSPDLTPDMRYRMRIETEVMSDAVKATLPMPGCKAEDFNIEVVGTTLTIQAVRKSEEKVDGNARYLRQERSFGRFEESVKLPVKVKGGEASATYKDGVLTVTLPRETVVAPTSHVVKVD